VLAVSPNHKENKKNPSPHYLTTHNQKKKKSIGTGKKEGDE